MISPPDLGDYTLPSPCVDSDHPDIIELVTRLVVPAHSQQDKAISLYYWVRDEIRYNPYTVSIEPEHYLASHTLAQGEGWCVPKAILLAALCRAAGIPARLGFADVRNHLSTAQMRELMETDVFLYHGYTAIWLDGQWLKATPAFNIQLCERFGLLPLEFNGREDSIYHPHDSAGNRHMEYLNDRGQHLDLPFGDMMATFNTAYPRMMAAMEQSATAENQQERWQREVDQENTC